MSSAPSPAEALMVLAAATRDRRAASAARARDLIARVDWAALLADLEYQRLVPLLGGRILAMAGSRAPTAFAQAVTEQTERSRDAGALLELTTLRVATALEAAGVANVPLKGPLLARALHGDPGMRSSRDIDVLVARDDFAPAVEALEPLGWRLEPDPVSDPVLHLCLLHEAGLPDIELHWRVHWYEADFGARMLARAAPGADGVRRLLVDDELAALMLYQARDGFAGLRHPSDVAAWWDRHGRSSGPPALEPIVRAHPGLARALTASAALVDRLAGVPATCLVGPGTDLSWRQRRALALANPLMRGEPEQITAEVSLVDGLLAPKGQGGAFVRRRALPSARDLPPSDRPIAIARAEHSVRLAWRYVVAVLRSRPGVG
jgi:Uncharacterised nucleotidyltransferase